MEGPRTCLITGATSGLGLECATQLARRGVTVLAACRNEARAQELRRRVGDAGDVRTIDMDLGSLASIRRAVAELTTLDVPALRGLVLCAGVQVAGPPTTTSDGFESTFGVNHLGHFLLANLVAPLLEGQARIVVVSSGTHDPDRRTFMPPPVLRSAREMAFPVPDPEQNPANAGRQRYTTSKLCNVLFAYELSRRLTAAGSAVTVTIQDPGLMPATGLARNETGFNALMWNYVLPWLPRMGLLRSEISSAQRSGRALAELADADRYAGVTDQFFVIDRPRPSSAQSRNPKLAATLWEQSATLVDLPNQAHTEARPRRSKPPPIA